MQTKWASSLNPVLINPLVNGLLISGVSLKSSAPTVVNHTLGRQMQGWVLADQTADAVVWRSAPLNNLTLTLSTSADTSVSLWVF